MLIAGPGLRKLMEKQAEALCDLLDIQQQQEIEHLRYIRDMVQNFRLAIDGDSETLRDGLEDALVDLNDHVARLEEHQL